MEFLIQSPQNSGEGKSCLITDDEKKPLIFQVSKNLRKPCKIVNSKISKNKIVTAIEIPPSACRYFESIDSRIVKYLSNKSIDFFERKLSTKDIKEMLIPSVIDKCIQVKIRDNVEIFQEKGIVGKKHTDLEKLLEDIQDKCLIPRICVEGIYFWSTSCQVIMSAESFMVLNATKPNFIFEDSGQDDAIVTPFPQMITSISASHQNPKHEQISHTVDDTNNEKLSGIGCNFLTIVEEDEDEENS